MKKTILSLTLLVSSGYLVISLIENSHYVAGSLGLLRFQHVDPTIEFIGLSITCLGPLILLAVVVSRLLQNEGENPLFFVSVATLLSSGCAFLVSLPSLAQEWYRVCASGFLAAVSLGGLITIFAFAGKKSSQISDELSNDAGNHDETAGKPQGMGS